MKTVYSIYAGSDCICEEYAKAEAIAKATAHFQDQREEDGFIGNWEEEIKIVTYDALTDKETEEVVTISGEAEEYIAP